MAVSLLETTSARTAGQYIPASRIRASRELIEQAGADFCRQNSVLPLWREPGGVLVATIHPRNQGMLRALREALGQTIIVRISGRGEIRIGIDTALGQPVEADWRRALAELLQSLRILRPDQAETYVMAAEDEAHLGDALVEAGLISEEERQELIGLAFQMPSIDLAEHPPQPGLDALLSPETMRELHVLPLWTVQEELFIAMDGPPSTATIARLDRELGLPLRPVLVQPSELRAHLAAIPDEPPLEPGELGDAVRREGLVTRVQFESATQIAGETHEPIETALVRLYGITRDQIEAALARRAGIDSYRGPETVDPQALTAIPHALARTLQVAVIGRSGGQLTVAMVNPWHRRTLRGLTALTRSEMRPLLATAGEITAILSGADDGREAAVLPIGDPLRTSALLLQAAFIDRAAADAADIDIDRLTGESLPRMWQMLENGKRSEAVALDAGLPRLHQLLMRPDPAAAALRPTGVDAPLLLPVLQEGDVLTVAIGSPDIAEQARELASAHRQSLRLAITREDDLTAAQEQLATLNLAALSPQQAEVGRLLEQRFALSNVDVLSIFGRMQEHSEPLDVAATRLNLLTAEQICDAFAIHLGTESVELRRVDRLETTVNDSGVAVTRRVLEDPLDHELARLLTMEEAERWGALPVRRVNGSLVLAMADPLDAAVSAALRERLGGDFYVQPSTRSDIGEASRRAHARMAIGDLLLQAGAVTRQDLDRALLLAERSGVKVGEALLSLRAVSEEELHEQLAHQAGLAFYTLRGLDLQIEIADLLPEELCREHDIIPIARAEDGTVTLAVADPPDSETMAMARDLLGGDCTLIGTTRTDIRDALERLYHRDYLEHSAEDLLKRFPGDSAHIVLDTRQKWVLSVAAIVIIGALVLWTVPTLIVLLGFSTFFYLAFSAYKFYLIYRALSHTLEVPVTDEDVAALDDRDLPYYTILVPLYREANVLPALVAGLSRLDYPLEKLDVKLLLEEDDPETIAVARLANLPSFFDITIVPDGQPKGKPKACNYGMLHARGEYAVIFDAEDIPDPDQLKRVLVAFGKSAENVVCIQAKLNYYNAEQNVLTKWFTTEYSTWFDLFLPGLDASGAPIPLGGTSNHFKVEALKTAGGWDPFNVTEDADLGLRIFKMGGSTAVVDSTTMEEANSVLDNWIRQRSRWVKGYILTYLVHMRRPLELWRQLGPAGFLSFQLVIGGTFFGFLLNPLLWGLTGLWFITEWGVIQQIFPGPIYYMGAISLYAGNFAFAYMNVAGCLRRRYYTLVKWALLSPVYWVLMSIAAWKGFLQLFYAPFYWEKTIHGLSDTTGMDAIEQTAGK